MHLGFIYEERPSDSPYIEHITHGYTAGTGSTIRPAESHWHMVFVRFNGKVHSIVTGPLRTSGVVSYTEGAEILWIKFKLGTYMPHLPAINLLDKETFLPEASNQSFWLNSSAWELPDFENVDTFIDRLVREEVLMRDPVVNAVLQEQWQPQDVASRTIRHRFQHVTGLSQNNIHQIERAQRAAALLRHGVSISDAVFEAGYYDQPHLTRALKQWVGHTPAQIARQNEAESD
jgi:AraC-like DNA-binding protein